MNAPKNNAGIENDYDVLTDLENASADIERIAYNVKTFIELFESLPYSDEDFTETWRIAMLAQRMPQLHAMVDTIFMDLNRLAVKIADGVEKAYIVNRQESDR